MAYSEKLASRIRERFSLLKHVEEKKMMGGLTFMFNDKMCVGVIGDDMMCRIDPVNQEAALKKPGCRVMEFTKRPMKGYVMVDASGMKSKNDFENWIKMCLEFNDKAKSSKRKNTK